MDHLPTSETDRLSAREIEVLELLTQGNSREEVASIMGISKLTYDSYRKNIRHKLHIKSQSDWARILYSTVDKPHKKDINDKSH